MVTYTERELTDAEREELTLRRNRLRNLGSTALLKFGIVSLVGCGVLAVVTILASDAPALVIVGLWSAMAMLFSFWIGIPERRQHVRQATALDDALRTNRARAQWLDRATGVILVGLGLRLALARAR